MSSDLEITFGLGTPTAAVDVISPDQQVIHRLMMAEGERRVVSVPSEASFLRVHLPSGRTVILTDPGNLHRTITPDVLRLAKRRPPRPLSRNRGADPREDEIARSEPPRRNATARRQYDRGVSGLEPEFREDELLLGSYGLARLVDSPGHGIPVESRSFGRGATWELRDDARKPPLELQIDMPDNSAAAIRIPGNVRRLWTRAVRSTPRTVTYVIRAQSRQSAADTILDYLRHGNMAAAEAMLPWAETSAQLLADKMDDPYAAAVGAYLLLRLQRFELLRHWPRNLANWMEFLPDGCVIWASQLIHQRPDSTEEIRTYLLKAVERGLPIYTEGLRLLLDGLRLLGQDGAEARGKVRAVAGTIRWESPLTARIVSSEGRSKRAEFTVTFDVGFGAPA
jgi:hypothetical protein